MRDAAIGIFDSGVGGLTVVRALRDRLPLESIVYFGDTARVPYGSKSEETVRRFAGEDTAFLISKRVKLVVAACNTATAIALPFLESRFPVPVIGVVEPGARRAVALSRNGRIGVIGTVRTIASGAYRKAILALDPALAVHEAACPLFVPLIEEGWLEREATRLIVREYLDPLVARGIDTLVLGCTHYPLIAPLIGECYPGLTLVDSASSTAALVAQLIGEEGLVRQASGPGTLALYLSDYTEAFTRLGETILGHPVRELLHPVSLEELEVGVS